MTTDKQEHLEGQVMALQMVVMMLYASQPMGSQKELDKAVPNLLNNLMEGLLPKSDQYLAGIKSVLHSFTVASSTADEIWDAKQHSSSPQEGIIARAMRQKHPDA